MQKLKRSVWFATLAHTYAYCVDEKTTRVEFALSMLEDAIIEERGGINRTSARDRAVRLLQPEGCHRCKMRDALPREF